MEVARFSSIPKFNGSLGEDRIFASDDFIAIVDGATPKVPATGGGADSVSAEAADRIVDAIARMARRSTAREAIDTISSAVVDISAPGPAGPSAAVIIFSSVRHEIWSVGSGSIRIDDQVHYFTTAHEHAAASSRSVYLTQLLQSGGTVSSLQSEDPGRQFILPLLRDEHLLRNVDADGPWYFGSIDGTHVPDRFVRQLAVPAGTRSVTLASDGYPVLAADYVECEQYLTELVKTDPLMIARHPQTKGVARDATGYDDRSYIQLELGEK